MKEQISADVIAELVQFLLPETPNNLRHQALSYVIGISGNTEFSTIFKENDFLVGRSLCKLACENTANEARVLPALINATAADVTCANCVINDAKFIHRCIESCRSENENATSTAKLLSNLSLHFPDKLYNILSGIWMDFIADIVVRRSICEEFLRFILPLVDCSDQPKKRLIAVDILRNLCFDSNCHPILLDENDEFLSALLRPLADVNDNLDDDETEQLPLQLQYYEGCRCEDRVLLGKIIDALYQLCGSAVGRKTLRTKGAYALLREFDRASSSSSFASLSSPPLTEKWNSEVAEKATALVLEDGTAARLHGECENQSASVTQSTRQILAATITGIPGAKFFGAGGNFVYIDEKNCSTLHALIGLLIQE